MLWKSGNIINQGKKGGVNYNCMTSFMNDPKCLT